MIKYLPEFDQLKLKQHEYVLAGSAVLAIRNIRRNADLDVLVSNRAWNRLCKLYGHDSKAEPLSIGKIEIYKTWPPFIDPDKVISNRQVINGHSYMSIEDFKHWKESKAREKDMEDLKSLSVYLKN